MEQDKGGHLLTLLASEILENTDLDKTCNFIFHTFQEIVPFDRLGVALLDKQGNVKAKWIKSKLPTAHLDVGYSAPLKGSSLQAVVETKIPRILNNLEEYFRDHPESESTQKILADGIRSSLTCPLVGKDGCVGFMFFSSCQVNTYEKIHSQMFEAISTQLSFLFGATSREQKLAKLSDQDNFYFKSLHEIGNALNLVTLFSQLIKRKLPIDAQLGIKSKLDVLVKQTQIIMQLFDDLRNYKDAYAEKFSIHPEPVDLLGFLNEFELAAQSVCKSKDLSFQMIAKSSAPKVIEIDGKRISQVLLNLLSNAVKYSFPESTIELETSRPDKETVQFTMTDHGKGLSKSQIQKLFDKDITFSNVPTGHERSTGLGLSICKRIIESHGGKIWADGEEGKGCKFSFSLPMKMPA